MPTERDYYRFSLDEKFDASLACFPSEPPTLRGDPVPAFLDPIRRSEARRHDRIAEAIEATAHTGIHELVQIDDLGLTR